MQDCYSKWFGWQGSGVFRTVADTNRKQLENPKQAH